ncbi:heparan-alpha-glucosaminide N-acetyltransferase-like [Prorops nasuta]|uniref:heparan-alpha-glucosaminide N-acetyltransferase-like n=1 Tax=Prorops nasuta TaxID=863751 RepID=UPI0034CD7213
MSGTAYDCGQLTYDEACILLRNDVNKADTWLYSLSVDCLSCPYTRIAEISPKINSSLIFNAARSSKWRVIETDGRDEFISAQNTSNIICELLPKVGPFGVYQLLVNDSCHLSMLKNPINTYIPLLIIMGIVITFLITLSLLRSARNFVRAKCMKQTQEVAGLNSTKKRIKSIDTFRGISILLMIFVNDGAGGYYALGHATWNGLLLGDLVFPCFIWIMGVCIPIALSSQLNRGIPKRKIALAVVKRSILLFLIGVSLNTVVNGPQLENVRVFGVLQRFGVTYLFVSMVYLLMTRRKHQDVSTIKIGKLEDVVSLAPQWIIVLIIVAVHSALTFKLSVPGCPEGYLGPGGRHENGLYYNCTGGVTGYIDRLALGIDHLYKYPTIKFVYGSGTFDPEGMFGCLTSIFQVFLGLQTGQILKFYKDWRERVTRWLFWAVALGCLGCALHFTNVIPVNKNLWSLSFVLVTTSFAMALFSGCYLLVDVAGVWRGGPFRIPGMNSLVMYVGHILCYKLFPFHWRYGKMNTHTWALVESLWGVALWIIIAYILHRKRMYIAL